MNYKKIYDSIIEKRRINDPTGYSEKHHIIPRSMGGRNDNSNIVALTAREHFLCHYLLVKIYIDTLLRYKAIHAFMMMQCSSKNQNRVTSRVFEQYRIEYAKEISRIQAGEGNSQFGTAWYYNNELKETRKFDNGDVIPIGWNKGRVINWDSKEDAANKRKIKKDSKQASSFLKREKALKIIVLIKAGGFNSIPSFQRAGYYPEFKYSQALIGYLKRYAKEEYTKLGILPGFNGKTFQ